MFTRYLFLLVSFSVLISGCTSSRQYRTNYELCQSKFDAPSSCATSAIRSESLADGSNYLLGFVEFDDQGQLWDRRQMAAVVDTLSEKAAGNDLLIVVFAHGWQHNAAPGDGNIETFRKVLAKLSEDEKYISQLSGKPARTVAGVYLGWRGESISIPLLNNLTFWDRKNTAEKVGHGAVTEVFSRLEQLKRDKESTDSGKNSVRMVSVGHSFGGLVLHTALSQMLANRFVRTTGPDGIQADVDKFGDLVVLINPAFQAQLFSTLSDMSAERGTYFNSQMPVMAVLTSEADYATRYAFPAGRWVSTLFEKTRDTTRWNAATKTQETISESETNVDAVGHFAPYRTHKLYPAPTVNADKAASLNSSESIGSALSAAAAWEDDKPGSKIQFTGVTLERENSSVGRNPYLVISVDRKLIRDHNDIDDPRVVEFIKQLITLSVISPEKKAVLYKAVDVPPQTQSSPIESNQAP
ncbi:MAG: esterase/lipase/thioesterase family active site protein [Verrucomicrobiaceae bacterium]|nr:esterase/lipase/thioesterase family active site protein [Verrucomicrobiaceae bacterium]